MIKILKLLRKAYQRIFLAPIAFLFAVLSVNLGILLLPVVSALFAVYKSVIVLLAKCVMPGSKVLNVNDSMMAKDDFHKDVDLYIYVLWYFEGRMDYEDLFKMCDERIVKKQRPNGDLRFPELQCTIETFLGYFFYKPDKKFDLKNHISLYKNEDSNNSFIGRRKLDQIIKKFTYNLYPKKRSPWEILLVNNVRLDEEGNEQEYSVMVTRCHHCMGDAYSGLLVFWESLLQQDLKPFSVPKSSIMERSKWKLMLELGIAAKDLYIKMFSCAFDYIYSPRRLYDYNKWHTYSGRAQHAHCTLPPIETSVVKEISSKNGVSITTVLVGIVTGGLRRMMEAKGYKSPKHIRLFYSLPLPNHPGRLTTHAVVTYFDVKITNSEENGTMKLNENSLKVAVRAVLAFSNLVIFLLGPIPLAWQRYNPTGKDFPMSGTMFCENAPLPPPSSGTDVHFLGCRLDRVYSCCIQSPDVNNPATTLGIIKYKDTFCISYAIQRHLFTNDDELYEIEKYVLEEVAHLKKAVMEKEVQTTAITIDGSVTKL